MLPGTAVRPDPSRAPRLLPQQNGHASSLRVRPHTPDSPYDAQIPSIVSIQIRCLTEWTIYAPPSLTPHASDPPSLSCSLSCSFADGSSFRCSFRCCCCCFCFSCCSDV
jgi:hypothetical protein